MSKITKKYKKGSVLIMSLIILSVIIVVGLSLAATTLRNRRSSIESARSNQALQKAEASSEKALDVVAKAGAGDTVDSLSWWTGMLCSTSTGTIEGVLESIELYDVDNNKIDCDDNAITILEIDRIKAVGVSPDTGEKRALMATAVHNGIETCEELQDIENGLNGEYVLLNDIDCSATNPAVGGSIWGAEGFDPIGNLPISFSFKGKLDGQGFKIHNLYINRNENNIGLFGVINNNAEISNLILVDPIIMGGTGDRVGSLVGDSIESNISNIYIQDGIVKGGGSVGGLVGSLWGNSSNALNSCVIDTDIYGVDKYVGGLVGNAGNTGGDASSVYNSCAVGGTVSGDSQVGGLIGRFRGDGKVKNTYSAMKVIGNSSSTGMFVGSRISGTIVGSYCDRNLNSFSDICGNNSCSGEDIEDESTSKMQKKNTYAGASWDIGNLGDNNLWNINNDDTYPCHEWWLGSDPDNECPK